MQLYHGYESCADQQMAKKSIRLIPGLGWFMLMSGAVFIDRSNNKSAIASMTQAGDDMKQKNVSGVSLAFGNQADDVDIAVDLSRRNEAFVART